MLVPDRVLAVLSKGNVPELAHLSAAQLLDQLVDVGNMLKTKLKFQLCLFVDLTCNRKLKRLANDNLFRLVALRIVLFLSLFRVRIFGVLRRVSHYMQ